MRRFLSIVLAGLLLVAVAAGFTALALRPPSEIEARRARIADLAQAGVDKGDWPGIMWAEVAPGRIVALGAAGFADISEARAMSPDTIMPIGSISKVVIGLAAAQAIGDGALDPQAPLADYLGLDIAWPDEYVRRFTDLATHTSGILDSDAGYEAAGYHFGATRHPQALGDFLADYLTETGALYDPAANFSTSAPGSRYSYSNIGAGLAALAVAASTETDFATYSARVLEPLELSGDWGHLGPPPAGSATLYTRDQSGAFDPLPPYGLATWPDGQFNASARDLAKLLATVLGRGEFDGVRLYDPAMIDRLTAPRVSGLEGLAAPEDKVGLFWTEETLAFGIWRQRLEGHSGGDPGVVTMMYRKVGRETGFVLMLNGEPEGLTGLVRLVRIVNLLAGMPSGG